MSSRVLHFWSGQTGRRLGLNQDAEDLERSIRRKARDTTVFSTSVPEVSHIWCSSEPIDAEITGSICGDPERAKGRN